MTHRFCQLFLEDHLASWGLQRLHFFNPNDGNGSVAVSHLRRLNVCLQPKSGFSRGRLQRSSTTLDTDGPQLAAAPSPRR